MRKGQAALEFLMTYGWAILVVLAAVGALAYFGVLSPGNFIPDQCVGSTGSGCVGKPDIQTGYVQVIVVNGLGQSLVLNQTIFTVNTNTGSVAANLSFCARSTLPAACTATTYIVTDGSDFKILLNSTNTGNVFRGTLSYNWTDANTGFTNSQTIQISGRVKR